MNFEQPNFNNVLEKPTKPESLDDKWYEKFKDIAAFQDYEYLTGSKEYRDEQKRKFLGGEIENPQLDYPELDRLNFTQKEADLLNLKKEILNNEENKLIKQIYRWKVNEKIAEIRMLKAAEAGDDRRFSRYSRFIYGKPEKEIYEYTLSQVKKWIDKKIFDSDLDISEAAKRLNAGLFEALMNNESELDFSGYEIPKLKSTKGDAEYSAEEIKQAFQEALEGYQLSGWSVIVDEEGKYTSINVGQEDKEVRIPQARKLKQTSLKALVKHEIGTHVRRREKGERTKLKLLGLGLDRTLKGEEGIATHEEQKVRGANEFAGFAGYFASALATGVDGKKRNFREVFEILKDFYFIKSSKSKKEAKENAEKFAWNRCIRTFRGTTCETKGSCFTKDIAYREGNIGIWNVLKNNSEEERRFFVGKYDPGNPRHIWILDQLEITDEDLEKLEKQKA